MTTPEDQTREGRPVMAQEIQELAVPEAPELEAEMIVAYANLPLLADVADHIVSVVSRFGRHRARHAETVLEETWRESSGVRVFNSPFKAPFASAPKFVPEARDLRDQLPTSWKAPGPVATPDSRSAVAGLLWPLPGSRWQVVHLMEDGNTKREIITTMTRDHADKDAQ